MDVAAALIVTFMLLMLSVYRGINILYPLLIGLIIFITVAYKRGYKPKEIIGMILKGIRKSMLIISIMMLIGAIMSVWRASGTVAYVVYYGIRFVDPNLFILYAFLLSCVVSFLLGTSFGTVGTIGTILMVMVKGGDININIVAGAIMSGIYFGDRCSPMSSSANLVSVLTETGLYTNIKNMFRTTAVPFLIASIIYGILSFQNPLQLGENRIITGIVQTYNLNWVVSMPAIIILVLAFFKVDIKISMAVSILCGAAVAVFFQKETIGDVLKYIIMGYSRPEQSFLGDIMAGGGIISMINVVLIVLIAFSLSGVLEGASLLKFAGNLIIKLGKKVGIFAAVILTSIIAGAFGGSQTLAVMLTYQLVRNMYDSAGIDKYELAVDLENTAIVMAPLIPWNIAGAVPAAALTADNSYVLYSFYLYLIPLANLVMKKFKIIKRHKMA
ncbi:MAG TPA: Na+/H+ antiporter NhaC family protein [Bacillota bacterium]|mgnify:FL=1|nr:Na+/H+ antiporter NhaC family protein [Bacillota bacterium]